MGQLHLSPSWFPPNYIRGLDQLLFTAVRLSRETFLNTSTLVWSSFFFAATKLSYSKSVQSQHKLWDLPVAHCIPLYFFLPLSNGIWVMLPLTKHHWSFENFFAAFTPIPWTSYTSFPSGSANFAHSWNKGFANLAILFKDSSEEMLNQQMPQQHDIYPIILVHERLMNNFWSHTILNTLRNGNPFSKIVGTMPKLISRPQLTIRKCLVSLLTVSD